MNNFKEEFQWINNLIDDGYVYMTMPKKGRKKFYATKSKTLDDKADFDEFVLDKASGESWIPGKDTKGVFIKL